MTRFFILVSMILMSSSIFAQDVIVKKDRTTILSKVLEVNMSDIKYKKYSNLNGPVYTITKSDLQSINYENGEMDVFDESNCESTTAMDDVSATTQRLINKLGDARNQELINLYNRQYIPTDKIDKKNSIAKSCLIIYGVKANSIMSNDDIEMKFLRKNEKTPYGGINIIYNINILNKTDKTIYIDKGNCFRLLYDGTCKCYYDNTEQTTVNLGGGSGASLGLGSVAGVLGIGGALGQLANGVSVGSGSTHSVSKTYSQQRVIAIPPKGNRNLTEEKWVKTKDGNLLSSADYEQIEHAELLQIGFPLKRGFVHRGQTLVYSEDEFPWKREYIITYSKDENFATYSLLKTELFVHQIIGCQRLFWYDQREKYINGLDQYTLESYYEGLEKE